MSHSSPVLIRLESKLADEVHVQQARGELYQIGEAFYVRYEQTTSEDDKTALVTSTTIRFDEQSLRMIRHGAIESEQSFIPHTATSGYLQTSTIRFLLRMNTTEYHQQRQDELMLIKWSYELLIDEQEAGYFQLTLSIWEDGSR